MKNLTTKTNKLKWLLSFVLIFGGFAVYEIFEVLAHEFADKKYSWEFKIFAEFGLFSSVMVSVGHFHHWLIAAEEHKETENSFYSALIRYFDTVLSGYVNRGFAGITNKEMDYSELMHGLKHGDHVYWLITFDPRHKHQVRESVGALITKLLKKAGFNSFFDWRSVHKLAIMNWKLMAKP